MDPVTALILAGLAVGVGDVSAQAVKDGYAGLKALVLKRFAGSTKAEETLADFEADPETYAKPLAKQLEAAGAHEDEAIRQTAEQLVKDAEAAGVPAKFSVQVTGGKVGIIGDHGQVIMN